MMVRQAVLKGKDPFKLLEDVESIDKMGAYCILQQGSPKTPLVIVRIFVVTLHCMFFFFRIRSILAPKTQRESVARQKKETERNTRACSQTLRKLLRNYLFSCK